jgi:MFS family permease
MSVASWRRITSRIGWLVSATFLVAMVLYALGQFHIVVPEPGGPTGETFVDNLLESFAHAQAHFYPWDLTSSLLLAAGFIGLAILGATLRHDLDRDDVRGAVLAVTFLVAGTIGAAAQILFVGATEVATRPEYCDCGFLNEEIISRQMAHDIALNVVFWMTDTSIVLFAIGLLSFAALAAASEWVPGGLAAYARVLAGLVILSVVWGRVVVPLLMESGVELDYFRIGDVVLIVIAGLLVPIWAAWIALAARSSTPEPDTVLSTGD